MHRLERILKHIPSAVRTRSKSSSSVMSSTTNNNQPSTAGIIVIGDEILKGQTVDTNSTFISQHLYTWGVQVKKISVIGDELDEIAKEVKEFSDKYTHVVTSGGVGPTHDDMTFEGVARAFNENTHPHPDLVKLIKQYFGTDDLTSPKMKMAYVPVSAKLQYGESKISGKRTKYPMVSAHNVYMFPGIPSLLENAFVLFEDIFRDPTIKFYSQRIFVDTDEISISSILQDIYKKFKDNVSLGSYPDLNNSYYKVKLILESQLEDKLNSVCEELRNSLPQGTVVKYDENSLLNAYEKIQQLIQSSDNDFSQKLDKSIKTIEAAFERYSLNEICVGFNGGKDCTVLVHLVYAVFKKRYPDSEEKLKSLYIRSKLPFPEVEKFIQIARDKYHLQELMFIGPIKTCMEELKNQHPEIKGVFMGTRHTDPYSNHLKEFTPTDSDWPQFMRINPLLEWSYSDIWKFLRSLCVPYCSLYDRGYTSIGSMNNTHPNPVLQYIDARGIVCYKPAHQLLDDQKERDGRNK